MTRSVRLDPANYWKMQALTRAVETARLRLRNAEFGVQMAERESEAYARRLRPQYGMNFERHFTRSDDETCTLWYEEPD